MSLVFTLLLFVGENDWLFPALLSYLVLGILLYRGNKKMFLVPYDKDEDKTDDA